LQYKVEPQPLRKLQIKEGVELDKRLAWAHVELTKLVK